jgi:hypothetical protein
LTHFKPLFELSILASLILSDRVGSILIRLNELYSGMGSPPSFTIESICSSMLFELPAYEEQLPELLPSLILLFLDGGFLADLIPPPIGSWKLFAPVSLLLLPPSDAEAFDEIES